MTPVQITIQDAHAEACLALGEAIVMERLLSKQVARLTAELERLAPAEPADEGGAPSP